MSIFVNPAVGRSGLVNEVVKHFFMAQASVISTPPMLAAPFVINSNDLTTGSFHQSPMLGDIQKYVKNWSLIPTPNGKQNCLIRNGRVIYFVQMTPPEDQFNAYLGIFISDDGRTFDRRDNPIPKNGNQLFAGFAIIGTRIYVYSTSGAGIYSDDNGDTWTLTASTGMIQIQCVAYNATTVVLGGSSVAFSSCIAYSTAPATTYTRVDGATSPYSVTSVIWDAVLNIFVSGSNLGKMASSNAAGSIWTLRSTPFSATSIRTLHVHPSTGRLFASYYDANWITSINGTAWVDAKTTFPFWNAAAGEVQVVPFMDYIDNNGDLILHFVDQNDRGTTSRFAGVSFARQGFYNSRFTPKAAGRLAA